MLELQNQIAELKAGRTLKILKIEDKKAYYKVKSLTSKLGELKAAESGNFITKEHLIEYKALIIWMMKNKGDYRGMLDLRAAMNSMLYRIENERIVYKTERSIKSIVCGIALSCGLSNSEENLREAYGFSVLENTNGNRVLEAFEQFKLNALMGN